MDCLNAAAMRAARSGATGKRQAKRVARSTRMLDVPCEPRINEAESPIAWLRRRLDRSGQPLISAEQFAAGERLRADLYRAQMTPRVTASWSGVPQSRGERRSAPGTGKEISDGVIAARERVTRALMAAGPEFIGVLIDVCGHLKGLEQIERDSELPQRSAKHFLQIALTALARHYGLLPPADIDGAIRARLRHWGADGYRPQLKERD